MLLLTLSCIVTLSAVLFIWTRKRRRVYFCIMAIFIVSNISGGCSTSSLIRKISYRPTCAINSKTISVKKDKYHLHRNAGKNLPGISLAKNKAQQQQLIKKEVLVSLHDQDFYVQKMHYGTPFVHNEMEKILIELQHRFEEKQKAHDLHDIEFVITSAYRTTSDQNRLRKVNRNATKSISSHSYGASVDIAKLSGKGCKQAVPLFQELLKEMQSEKKLYLCPESKTMHITARIK